MIELGLLNPKINIQKPRRAKPSVDMSNVKRSERLKSKVF